MQPKYLLYLAVIITLQTSAQSGIITGKVVDESNSQPLAGATVIIKNTGIKTLSDVDGVYKFNKLKPGNYTLEATYIGYTSKEFSGLTVSNEEVTSFNILMSSAQNNTLQNVVVTSANASKETLNSILIARRNAVVVSDAISADMIKRSPDKNIGDVLKRVSGTSIQDNKFVVVRGMNDRYNEALLNGCVLPSTESDRKTFAFDIFPSDLVDNITIIKSASAEYPASFAGGLVIVNLKDVPEKNFFSFKIGAGLNTITTNKKFYQQSISSLDFLGLDDGSRSLPGNFPSTKIYNQLPPNKQINQAKSLPNDWKLYKFTAPLNSLLQLSGAYTTTAKNGFPKFGALFGLSYNSTYRISHLANKDYGSVTVLPDSVDTGLPYYDFKDTSYTHTILSSALGNFTVKINPNNKFFFNNLLAINSTIQTITRGGESQAGTGSLSPYYAYTHSFQSNVIYNGQIGGEHNLPKLKLRIKWLAYYTNYSKNEPDYRQMVYTQPFENAPYFAYLGYPTLATTTNTGTRFYYDTKDIAKGVNLDFNKSFLFLNNTQSFKFGFASFDDAR
ncbi:MAG TPA: carboxypeptidase-like regulatory domain-containing protein, partial [Parafilimonas sp.]|nr:carboxypeptidase-like regulatory domain-containing protein [Parafilimonas sp.]